MEELQALVATNSNVVKELQDTVVSLQQGNMERDILITSLKDTIKSLEVDSKVLTVETGTSPVTTKKRSLEEEITGRRGTPGSCGGWHPN